MRIDHIAIWTNDLEKMRAFYQQYFQAKSGKKYENLDKGFSSYFLSFDSGSRIEIMTRKDIVIEIEETGMFKGYTHLAISVGSIEKVNLLTELLRADGYKIVCEPRTTGDGYFESVVLDPEGNHIEITE